MSVALPRLRRWLLGVLAALVAVVLVAAGLAVWTVRRSFPDVSGELTLPALGAPVTVYRDGNGITHLYADTP
ncbi:MAG TPA: hypothetical protein VKZ89_19275, partial [Thermobifida alba]|nr:hypothetical protein [Thermobifida alba]